MGSAFCDLFPKLAEAVKNGEHFKVQCKFINKNNILILKGLKIAHSHFSYRVIFETVYLNDIEVILYDSFYHFFYLNVFGPLFVYFLKFIF
jgi:hypothetical protein